MASRFVVLLVGFTHLQHVQQGRLSGVVETEEQQLCVLVEQAEGGENIVDCITAGTESNISIIPLYSILDLTLSTALRYACARKRGREEEGHARNIHQLIIHMLTRVCLASCRAFLKITNRGKKRR